MLLRTYPRPIGNASTVPSSHCQNRDRLWRKRTKKMLRLCAGGGDACVGGMVVGGARGEGLGPNLRGVQGTGVWRWFGERNAGPSE